MLRVDGLTVKAPEDGPDLVTDVSFRVGPGEVVCLVGESGSGKSVTARALLGLNPALRVSGEIWFRDRALHRTGAAALRGRELAMVFQEPAGSLDPLFTIGSQLTESLARRHGRLARRDRHTRMLRLPADVGIHDGERVLRSRPHELSGGMCQRVMIASALASEPELLIADEPTTALDVTVQAQILHLLDTLRTRRGMAILMVTHDMGVAAEIADRVLVMYSGRVVEDTTPQQAFLEPRHPYTAGLLSCVPDLGGPRVARLPVIAGSMPDPAHRPAGCAFHDRCGRASGPCHTETPSPVRTEHGHHACLNPIEVTTP